MIRMFRIPVLMLLLLSLGGGLLRAQEPGAGKQAVETNTRQALKNRQATQQERDQFAAEKSELVARLRSARQNVKWLQERRAAESARVLSLEERTDELSRRLAEADRLETSMQDTLLVLLDRVEESVGLGLPFLPQERAQRLQRVRGELARPDISAAEKLRRVLEVLQVEADYAHSVEVYSGRISVDGQELFADVLRLGRLALFWQTPDHERVGWFDQGSGQWVPLPASEKRNIGLAMEMATRRRPMELVDLPIGRIGGGE